MISRPSPDDLKPLQVEVGLGREAVEVRSGRIAHGLRDGFGLGAVHPGGFEFAGGLEGVEGAGAHGVVLIGCGTGDVNSVLGGVGDVHREVVRHPRDHEFELTDLVGDGLERLEVDLAPSARIVR